MKSEFTNKDFKLGVSGLMRVKNDEEFIEASIDSCIDALDELIIVYNDCSDNSPTLIEKKRRQYPDKIKVWEYKHKIYSINLTKEEYEYAKLLPDDSPNLLCNYYNFALSKVSYSHAMKIDADQIYFTEKLKFWCDVIRGKSHYSFWKAVIGFVYSLYIRFYCRIKQNPKISWIPLRRTKHNYLYSFYLEYLKKKLPSGDISLSLSGLDIFKEHSWYVTMGRVNNIINILPPYNGVGDHLIFKVTPETYYRKDDNAFYNKLRSDSFTIIERFVCPAKCFCAGTFWFHLNSLRVNVKGKVLSAKLEYPQSFIEINKFLALDFNQKIEPLIDKSIMTPFHNFIFEFVHQNDSQNIKQYIKQLYDITIN